MVNKPQVTPLKNNTKLLNNPTNSSKKLCLKFLFKTYSMMGC